MTAVKSVPKGKVIFLACPILDVGPLGDWVPTLQDADRESPQLGVYLLAGILRRQGFDVEVFDWVARPGLQPKNVAALLAEADVLLCSSNSMNWAAVLNVVRLAKTINSDLRSCVGGPHPTHYPQSVAQSFAFDGYFRGEADRYVCDITSALLERKRVQGIPGYQDCRSASSGLIPLIHTENSLDDLDWEPAYELIPDDSFLVLPLQTSRGCKFQCTFCSIPSKKNWRPFGHVTGLQQIELASTFRHKARSGTLSIVDDTFTTDNDRILKLCDSLDTTRFANSLMYDATLVDVRNDQMMERLAPFTSDMLIGAEVASKEDSKRIKKAATPKLIFDAARVLSHHGIAGRAVFSFIIGFPWHTKDDCIRVVQLAKELVLEYGVKIYLQWYWPMPGSEIWNDLAERKLVTLVMMDEPGFFRRQEWFFPIRTMQEHEVRDLDEKIRVAQQILDLYRPDPTSRAIEYGSPLKMWGDAKVNRNPHLVRKGEAEVAGSR